MMLEMLETTEKKYEELNHQLSDIKIISDQNKYRELMKEHSELEPLVIKYREYKKYSDQIKQAEEMIEEESDDELIELAKLELEQGTEALEKLDTEIKILLLPKDHNDDKNVIVEIRGGAGGEEAALFAYVLYRMYSRYAEKNSWRTSVLDVNETEIGGFKEVVFLVEGIGAYSKFKYESGVHRVQRVPATEASGRIHTSTVTVAVLPETEEVEIDIKTDDLRIDTYRSSGAGGQHVNKTDSAVRITHIPTGIVVQCQNERSQHRNKDNAMKILRARLYEKMLEDERAEKQAMEAKKKEIAWGSQIRSYVLHPYTMVKDHRTGVEKGDAQAVLEGKLDQFIQAYLKMFARQ